MPSTHSYISTRRASDNSTMKNEIHNRKPTFGDPEQIDWLKKQARLKEAADAGPLDIVIEQVPMGDAASDQHTVIRFKCPDCLMNHHFGALPDQEVIEYEAPCGTTFHYENEKLEVRL